MYEITIIENGLRIAQRGIKVDVGRTHRRLLQKSRRDNEDLD